MKKILFPIFLLLVIFLAACQPSKEGNFAEAQQVIAIATQQARATAQAYEASQPENVTWGPRSYNWVLTELDYDDQQDEVIERCSADADDQVIVSASKNKKTFNILVDCNLYIATVFGDTGIESPAANPTPRPTATPHANGIPDLNSYLFNAVNVPVEVVTIKVNTTGGYFVPKEASVMLDNEGVLGKDGDCGSNQSCVNTLTANHNQAQGPIVYDTIPEGSYWTSWAESFKIEGAVYTLELPDCGPHCVWGVLLRGWHLETHADRHLGIKVSNYGTPGAMKYTRYPVAPGYGQFFSEDYFTAQAENALNFDNCGIGTEDCDVVMAALFDYNDGSLTIMRYLGNNEWEVVWTNIVGYGRD